jgi:2-iminobutanoate/2-iminopropanoate deaminase
MPCSVRVSLLSNFLAPQLWPNLPSYELWSYELRASSLSIYRSRPVPSSPPLPSYPTSPFPPPPPPPSLLALPTFCLDLTALTHSLTHPPRVAAGPYTQAIATPQTLYLSGQIPANPDGSLVEGSIGDKTAACIRSIEAILKAAGSSLDRVVKVNVFLTDMDNFAAMNAEYEKWFTTKPARSCVAVRQLPKGVDVEIECVALPWERESRWCIVGGLGTEGFLFSFEGGGCQNKLHEWTCRTSTRVWRQGRSVDG